jgi:hypothetical protein
MDEFREIADNRLQSSGNNNDIRELFTALDFIDYLGELAFNKIEVVK